MKYYELDHIFSNKKYLFLNHIGVIFTQITTFDNENIQLLNTILSKYKVDIISSINLIPFRKVKRMYKKYGICKLPIGVTTPYGTIESIEKTRAIEIALTARHYNINSYEWIAIDELDLRLYFPPNNFLWINDDNGLISYSKF